MAKIRRTVTQDRYQPQRCSLSRREFLVGAAATAALSSQPVWAIQPKTLSAWADKTSYLPGETIKFGLSAPTMGRRKVSIRYKGDPANPELTPVSSWVIPPYTDMGTTPYALGAVSQHPLSVIVQNTWRSGPYLATFTEPSDPDIKSEVWFVVRGTRATGALALVVIPWSTMCAYNFWGGASLYHAAGSESAGYIKSWDEIRFSFQVAYDRPGDDASQFLDGTRMGWPVSCGDLIGGLAFIEAELGLNNVDYATSTDLHADASLLSGYNLFISIGHDEYWSAEMRDHLESFIASGGNACFFGANTCWWQVRFEKRNSHGCLISADDPAKMVCYKLAGAPVGGSYYGYWRDPEYSVDPVRTTTHWHAPMVNRPENRLTGLSFRNGAMFASTEDDPDPSSREPDPEYVTEYATHWAFKQPPPSPVGVQPGFTFTNGSQFGKSTIHYSPEWDAADLISTPWGKIGTGADGGPLNLVPLATLDGSALNSSNPYGQGPGKATMVVHRNNGVVFNAGILGWRYGMAANWRTNPSGPEQAIAQISANILRRLITRGPWKFETQLKNAYFESWTYPPSSPVGGNSALDWWTVYGGTLGVGAISKGNLAPSGNHALLVDGRQGTVWISTPYTLNLEYHTNYRIGVFVNASAVGAVAAYLVTASGNIFAIGHNTASGVWQTVTGDGQFNGEGAVFDVYVYLVVFSGATASFSDISVWEMPTAAVYSSILYSI